MKRWGALLLLLVPLMVASSLSRCQSPLVSGSTPVATNTAIHPSSSRWTLVLPGGATLHPTNPERMQAALDSLLAAIQVQTGPGYSTTDLAQAFASFARLEVDLGGTSAVATPAGPISAARVAVVSADSQTVVLLQNAAKTWLPFSVLDPEGSLMRALADLVLSETGVRLVQSTGATSPSRTSTASPQFIKITDPVAGTTLKGTVTVRGRAGAIFENQFQVELLDGSGVKLAEGIAIVAATTPGGSGAFQVVLGWNAPTRSGTGTIWAYERSAKDGSIAVQDKVQVTLEGK